MLCRAKCVLFSSKTRMLHVWLVPALVILVVVLGGFYLLMRFKGGSGVRSEGRTIVDEGEDESDLPPR